MFSNNKNIITPNEICTAFVEVVFISMGEFVFKITLDKFIEYKKYMPVFMYKDAKYECLSSSHESQSSKMEFICIGPASVLKDKKSYIAEINKTKKNYIIKLSLVK